MTVTFGGKIVDAVTGAPVPGAEVSIPELELVTVTGTSGDFILSSFTARRRSYEVLVTCPGYMSLFADVKFHRSGSLNVNYELRRVGW